MSSFFPSVSWELVGHSGDLSCFDEGGAAGEPWETAEADGCGAGGASQKPASCRPKEPRVGGVPAKGALPHLRGTDSLQLLFIFLLQDKTDFWLIIITSNGIVICINV